MTDRHVLPPPASPSDGYRPTDWPPPSWPPPSWPPGPYQRPRRRFLGWFVGTLAFVLALAVVIAMGPFLAGRLIHPPGQTPLGQAPGAPPAAGQGPSAAQVSAVAAKLDPGVVDITTVLGYQNGAAAGTGIVLTSDGLVLTNNHVVAGATSINVTDVGNGQAYRATVVGYDRTEDIAVVKLSGASGLTVAPMGDSSTVSTGDGVVAIGNAGGAGGTPSAVGGSVTALDQAITAQDATGGATEQLTGLIQIAAAIQPGDSGGPLATTSGQIIGVDTAASASFRYQAAGGEGFAIPINAALTIAKRIEAGQASSVIHIGATAFLGIETGSQAGGGTLVLGVLPGSPAESIGLSRGDLIESVNGTGVDSATALTEVLDRYHPGDPLTLAWTDRSGQSHTATVTAADGPVG